MDIEALRKQLVEAEAQALAPQAPAVEDYTPPREAKLSATTWITMEHHSRAPHDGSFTGEVYRARVQYTVPGMDQLIMIGKMKTAIATQPLTGDSSAATIVNVVAYLTMTLDPSTLPSWWNPTKTKDFAPYFTLYQEVLAYEARFLGGRDDRRGDPRSADEGAGDQGAAVVRSPSRVGRRVQPPVQRSEPESSDDEGGDGGHPDREDMEGGPG